MEESGVCLQEGISLAKRPSADQADEEEASTPRGRNWGRCTAVVAMSLCLVVVVAAVLTGTHHSSTVERGEELSATRRSEEYADLSAQDSTPLETGRLVTDLDLVEESDGEDGTHKLKLAHNGVEFGTAKSWHNKPAAKRGGAKRVPTLNADKLMKQARPGEDGAKATFMVCHQHHDISKLPPMHITKVVPKVTKIPGLNFDNSVVHHMSIFLCTEREGKNGNIGRCEDGPNPVLPKDSMHKPCYRMAYTYDRDGKPFTFPPNVGVRVGKGTPYTRIVQEWHYLLPKAGLGSHKFTDRTHFEVTLTKNLRQHNAAILGSMNEAMKLPPGKVRTPFSYHCKSDIVKLMLKNDFEKFGSVNVFAVHLHSHNRGKKLWWSHLRKGKKIGEYGRFSKYNGYGPDETWMHLNTKLNPPDRSKVTVYGTNHGEEMCGFLLMYYPHDHTRIKHHEDKCIVG